MTVRAHHFTEAAGQARPRNKLQAHESDKFEDGWHLVHKNIGNTKLYNYLSNSYAKVSSYTLSQGSTLPSPSQDSVFELKSWFLPTVWFQSLQLTLNILPQLHMQWRRPWRLLWPPPSCPFWLIVIIDFHPFIGRF